jgi:Arc/MetJ family transcription regulator
VIFNNGASPYLTGVTRCCDVKYNIHMKRTNLVLDALLLETAMRELQTKTYSGTVNLALQEVLRVRRIQRLSGFFGKGLWEGDLSEMRQDHPVRTRRPASSPRRRRGR